MNPEADRIARAYCAAFLRVTGTPGYVGKDEFHVERLAGSGAVKDVPTGDLVGAFSEAMTAYRKAGFSITAKAMCHAVVQTIAGRTAPPLDDGNPVKPFDLDARRKELAEIVAETEHSEIVKEEMRKIREIVSRYKRTEPKEETDE